MAAKSSMSQESKQQPCPLTFAVELAVNTRHAQQLEVTGSSTIDMVAYLAQNVDTLRMYAQNKYGSADAVNVESAAKAAAQDDTISAVLIASLTGRDKEIAREVIDKVKAES